MWTLKFAILTVFVKTAFAVQSGQYGCRSDGSYHIEFVLMPGGETIKSVFGGVPGNTNCQATQGQDGFFRLTIPIEDPNSSLQTDCGVINQAGTREFVLTVTTKSLDAGYKPSDRVYNVPCHFNGPVEIAVTTVMGIQLNSDTSLVVSNSLNPIQSVLNLELVSATTGLAVTDVSFMESVYLRVQMAMNYHNSESMRVTDCTATGYAAGSGMPTGQVGIIGTDGCPNPTTQVISSGFSMLPTDSNITQTVPFSMFLIQDAASVMFSCMVTLCVDGSCSQSCVPGGRRKRDTENTEVKSGEVIAVVRVGHLSEQEAVKLNSLPSNTTRNCVNWPYLVAIAALTLVLLVSLGFSMLLFTTRSRDSRVGDFREKPVA